MLGRGGSWIGKSSGGGAVAFDPSTTFSLFEDFSTGYYSGSGQINADHSWASIQSGSPGYQVNGTVIQSDANHPGVLEMSAASVGAADGAGITTGLFANYSNLSLVIGGGQLTFESLIYIPTLSDSVNNAQLDIGLSDSPGWSAGNNKINIEYQIEHGTPNWFFFTQAGGVQTSVTGTIAVATGWQKLKIVVNAAGTSVSAFVGGTLIGTITTNIPVGVRLPVMIDIRKTLGTTIRYLGIDYIKIDKTFTVPR